MVPSSFIPWADNVVHPGSHNCLGREAANLFSSFASAVWVTTNLAIYVPFVMYRSGIVYQVGWMNGGTTVSGTREVGVYNSAGSKMISGAATGSGTNVMQRVNVTDTTLNPGQYWLAITCTTASDWFAYTAPVPIFTALGCLTQTSANPLPSTMTGALNHAYQILPVGFLQMRSTI